MNTKIAHKFKLHFFTLALLFISILWNQNESIAQSRTNYRLPDIPGFIILKGDFHMHTPFSDGSVWPSDRVREAWRDGLDIIALTDHIEYSAYSKDVIRDLNRPFEIAKPVADELGIILIKGAEITRSMPPGHFNAYFLKDINLLKEKSVMEVFQAAAEQGAFFEWNHPGWKAQQPDTTIWFPMHTELYNKGWLNGIEVFNEHEYYPIVQQWAIDKSLTLLANSDSHAPMDIQYNYAKGEHRPMTLIFAKSRNIESVHQAMIEGRTAVLFNDTILGIEKLVVPLIENCLKIEQIGESSKPSEITFVLSNLSDFPIFLSGVKSKDFKLPSKLEILGNSSIVFTIKNITNLNTGLNNLTMIFKVDNVLSAPNHPIEISMKQPIFYWKTPEFIEEKDGFLKIDLGQNTDSISYFYTLNGEVPTEKSFPITQTFAKSDSIHLTISAFLNHQKIESVYRGTFFLHNAISQKINLTNQPNSKYFASGAQSLVDGIKGGNSYLDGKWIGFESKDCEAVIELKQEMEIKSIQIGFLEANKSWIFLPTSVQIFVSTDGINFTEFGKSKFEISTKESNRGRIETIVKGKSQKIKFIKVIAKNQNTCPAWHSGAGKAAWLFMDEIIVK